MGMGRPPTPAASSRSKMRSSRSNDKGVLSEKIVAKFRNPAIPTLFVKSKGDKVSRLPRRPIGSLPGKRGRGGDRLLFTKIGSWPKEALYLLIVFLVFAFDCIFNGFSTTPEKGLCLASPDYEERDSWYEDLDRHWARSYVFTLWEENVVNGYKVTRYKGRPGHRRREVHWYFYPDSQMNRAEYAILMVKVFGIPLYYPNEPTFADVEEDFSVYNRKNAFGFVEAAYRAGLVRARTRRKFGPWDNVTREQAVASLVRGLGLDWYSDRLTRSERDFILSRFRDSSSVSSEYADEMATAVRFKIIEGYPDGRLKPQNYITRAEGATICSRSCLVKVLAERPAFSPDGDGHQDSVAFYVNGLKNRNIRAWQLEVSDAGDDPVLLAGFGRVRGRPKSLSKPSESPSGMGNIGTVVWNGLNMESKPLPPGVYYYKAFVEDRDGQVFQSVTGPILLLRHSLDGRIHPQEVTPGGHLTAHASTSGKATRVVVSVEASGSSKIPDVYLLSDGPEGAVDNSWHGRLEVPTGFPCGSYRAILTACFESGAKRSMTLPFKVVQPQPGEPEVPPDKDLVPPHDDQDNLDHRDNGGSSDEQADKPPGESGNSSSGNKSLSLSDILIGLTD